MLFSELGKTRLPPTCVSGKVSEEVPFVDLGQKQSDAQNQSFLGVFGMVTCLVKPRKRVYRVVFLMFLMAMG